MYNTSDRCPECGLPIAVFAFWFNDYWTVGESNCVRRLKHAEDGCDPIAKQLCEKGRVAFELANRKDAGNPPFVPTV